MTTTAAPALELYDVVFNDPLGSQETSVVATCHDDAADHVAFLHNASIESTTRRRDGDYVDHAIAATFHFAQQFVGPDGEIIDLGDHYELIAA